MYPTGDAAQTGTATVTLTVPCVDDSTANDYLLDAITGQLFALTDPGAWDDSIYAITAADAAAAALAIFDSMTVTMS